MHDGKLILAWDQLSCFDGKGIWYQLDGTKKAQVRVIRNCAFLRFSELLSEKEYYEDPSLLPAISFTKSEGVSTETAECLKCPTFLVTR